MEASDIINAISTVGFPIVMCGALCWYTVKENSAMREAITKLEIAITKLTAKIAGGDNDEV